MIKPPYKNTQPTPNHNIYKQITYARNCFPLPLGTNCLPLPCTNCLPLPMIGCCWSSSESEEDEESSSSEGGLKCFLVRTMIIMVRTKKHTKPQHI